ncbi:hypothetical protein QR680_003472 [Steinernema hermaphroditum]|uniref:Cadherin domain-containing protein n=1 Tax=Steinernema hermaphroditum TaxID=289476 RepID=A0AA39H6Y6_9BILA|nr:hypothetical protein QR680_003472 [Steinernema hermaphroditum]
MLQGKWRSIYNQQRQADLVSGKSIWSALKVEGTPADSAWMKIMQCLVPTAENCCEFKANGKKFRATVGQNGVTETFLNRVNFWQYIGECLGLYSDEFPVLAIHSDRWMAKANDVVHGNTSQEILMREASAFLSRWDTLSTTNSYGIADMDNESVLSTANLEQDIPENCLQLADLVQLSDGYLGVPSGHEIFYRRAEPPENNYTRATVIFLHGQSFTSGTWLEVKTLKIFAALGYHCVAIDLPGCGRSDNSSVLLRRICLICTTLSNNKMIKECIFSFTLYVTVLSLVVDPPFLFVDEDWPVTKHLPVVVCSSTNSDIRIIAGNAEQYFSLTPMNITCCNVQLKKTLDSDIQHYDGQRWQSFTLIFEGRHHSRISLEIQVVDINDNAPQFLETPSKIFLSETTAVGTIVTRVKTFDPDTGIGGIVQFFVDNSKFSIRNDICAKSYCTAEIYLKSPLNYDSMKRESITVIARDGASRSKSSKESRITINANVIDEQTNAPFFITDLSQEYTVNTDSSIGDRLFQLEAEDGDRLHAKKNPVFYSLEPNPYFEINSSSGWIVLGKSLSDRQGDRFKLTVTATEMDAKRMHTEGTIKIRVVNPDRYPPQCEKPNYEFQIDPDRGQLVVSEVIKVFDKDANNRFNYFTLDLLGNDAHAFKLSHHNVTREANVIFSPLSEQPLLKYETFELWLRVPNSTQTDGRCTIRVLPSKPFALSTVLRFNVSENVGPIVIADLKHNVNGQTSSCEFFLESPEYGDRFALDTNGSLRTLQILDREDIDEYDLRVKVRRHANAEQYINVHVNVLDENDNAPELTMERKEFIIAENVAASIAITAFDPDYKENGTLSFALVNDNCDVCFINRTSGVITVNRIDADSVTNLAIPLKIAVSDLGKPTLSNSIEITLLVKDINDNSPQFKQADYTFMLSTSDKVGAIIGAVEAIDMDISGNVITYLTTDKYVEAIKDTGELRLSKLLPKSQTVHKFYVNASDSGTPNNSALVAVTIIVADLPTDTTTIERVVSIRKENVGQVVYKPEDQPGEFIYTSPLNETTADLVHVNERTGAIILKTWDNVSNFALNIDVRWRNSGDISRKEHLIFKISNLQGFQFDQLHYSTTIAKSTPVGAKIMAVRIMGDVYKYNITTEPAGQFNISSSGEVLLARDIDFEKPKVIRGIITAESNDGSTAEVTVSAEVFEDGGPMCKVNLSVTVHETIPVDEDGDTLTYSIEADGYHPFGVNSEGVLTMKDSVASPGKICAKAVVTDSGIPRKTTKKDFCITFIDRVAQNPVIHWPTENSAHKFPENKKFEELFTINATVSPLFTGIDKSLHYRFTEEDGEDWRGFAIENGGSLNHNVPFNFEEKQKYNIGLEVCDMKGQCTRLKIVVEVIDENDNCPFFQQQSSMFDIEENVAVSETGLIVGEFPAAVDFDSSPEHSTICYVISSITTYSFFLPNDRIPVLYLNQSLDREYADQIQISIRAQDCSPENSVCVDPNINPTRADHVIIINILDKNDNFPKFEKRSFHMGMIIGTVRPGEKIASISADDPDLEENGLCYSISASVRANKIALEKPPFEISEHTGDIKASMNFNGDLAKTYVFRVRVVDSVGHTDETAVVISVLSYCEQAEVLLNADNFKVEGERDRIAGLLSNVSSMQVLLLHFLDKDNNLASVADVLTAMSISTSDASNNARNILESDFG